MPILPRRLNTRVILMVSLILSFTGIVSGWVSARRHSERLTSSMREHSSVMSRNFADNCARFLVLGDYAELEAFLVQSVGLPAVRHLLVCDADGLVVGEAIRPPGGQGRAAQSPGRVVPPASVAPVASIENDRLIFWHPARAGNLLGWIRADFGIESIRREQAEAWEFSLLLAMFWVGSSGFLILTVLTPAARALTRLTDFARGLHECKGACIAVNHGSMEIDALEASLNFASERLFSAEQQMIRDREQLRESEAMYRSLVTGMAEGVVFQRADGTITAANPMAQLIMGTADPLIGSSFHDPPWDAIHEDGTPFPEDHHPAMLTLRTGKPQNDVVMGIRRSDHCHAWISMNSQPLIAPGESKPYAVVVTFHDITERKRAEAARRSSEERFRMVFENSPVSLWEEDFSPVGTFFDQLRREGVSDIGAYFDDHPDAVRQCAQMTTILDVNRAALAMHGAADKEELFVGLLRTFTEESLQTFRDELECLWKGDLEMTRDSVVLTLDGEPLSVSVYLAVCPGYETTFARVLVSLIDITERQKAVQARLDHLRFLEAMDRINRAIQGAESLEQMMNDVLEVVVSIFNCDRAGLVYPCDPYAPAWQVVMERSGPGYASDVQGEKPMDADRARSFRFVEEGRGTPVRFGPGGDAPVSESAGNDFGIRSFLAMAVYPKVGDKPWEFGIHQCSHPRVWTPEEVSLFQEVGRRLSDALTGLLSYRDLHESENELRRLSEDLDQRVRERTMELEAKNRELEKINRLFVGRELRMVELKKKMRELEREAAL